MTEKPKLPEIPESERTPLVVALLEVAGYQSEVIQQLKDEIADLKRHKKKPRIKPSNLEKDTNNKADSNSNSSDNGKKKRPGSKKRNKNAQLKVDETKKVKPEHVPPNSRFKGYKEYVVQGLEIKSKNIKYLIERWQTEDGKYIEGKLPSSVKGHFDASLICFILYQYHQCHVTQPLLLEALREYGVDISSGQLNRILIEDQDSFHQEKAEVLCTGLSISDFIQADDTGARHKGNNGYCTHIGNDFFAWFESTQSKSRINFLELLRAGSTLYCITPQAISYMKSQQLSSKVIDQLNRSDHKAFEDKSCWDSHLENLGIRSKRHIRIATEGALLAAVLSENNVNSDLAVISDDAGQFNILSHGLCWVHAERTIHKLNAYSDSQRAALESIREQIWVLYKDLKAYKQAPTQEAKVELEERFDKIFLTKTDFALLNIALRRLHSNKKELLLVLDRPEIPIHNNMSESDIREYAKRRKVSGGTRSDQGRKARDTWTSLKKTCRKLNTSFWQYLNDRIAGLNEVPRLAELMRQQATASAY